MTPYRIHFEQAVWMCPADACQALDTEQIVELQMPQTMATRCRILQDDVASKASRHHKRKASSTSVPSRKRSASSSVDRCASGDEVLSTDAPFPLRDRGTQSDDIESEDNDQSDQTWTLALGEAALEDELSLLLDSIAEDSADLMVAPSPASAQSVL